MAGLGMRRKTKRIASPEVENRRWRCSIARKMVNQHIMKTGLQVVVALKRAFKDARRMGDSSPGLCRELYHSPPS